MGAHWQSLTLHFQAVNRDGAGTPHKHLCEATATGFPWDKPKVVWGQKPTVPYDLVVPTVGR